MIEEEMVYLVTAAAVIALAAAVRLASWRVWVTGYLLLVAALVLALVVERGS